MLSSLPWNHSPTSESCTCFCFTSRSQGASSDAVLSSLESLSNTVQIGELELPNVDAEEASGVCENARSAGEARFYFSVPVDLSDPENRGRRRLAGAEGMCVCLACLSADCKS